MALLVILRSFVFGPEAPVAGAGFVSDLLFRALAPGPRALVCAFVSILSLLFSNKKPRRLGSCQGMCREMVRRMQTCRHATPGDSEGVARTAEDRCTATDFLPSGLYRRPRNCTGSYLTARGLGLRLTADREFHPALKVCECIQLCLSICQKWNRVKGISTLHQGKRI